MGDVSGSSRPFLASLSCGCSGYFTQTNQYNWGLQRERRITPGATRWVEQDHGRGGEEIVDVWAGTESGLRVGRGDIQYQEGRRVSRGTVGVRWTKGGVKDEGHINPSKGGGRCGVCKHGQVGEIGGGRNYLTTVVCL